jgi:hypothetical protein
MNNFVAINKINEACEADNRSFAKRRKKLLEFE